MTEVNVQFPQNNPWSREAAKTPYQVAAPEVAPAQYAPQPQYTGAQYGNHAPLVPYQNYAPTPAPAPNVLAQPEKGDKKLMKYFMIGAATLAAVGAVSSALFLKGISDTVEKAAPGTDHSASDSDASSATYEKYPVKFTADNASGDQFANQDPEYPYSYSRAEQLDYAGPKLNQDAQSAAERARTILGNSSNLTEDDGVTTRTIAAPSLANSPQQILDQFAVGTFQAWEMAHTGNIDEAKKLAAATADLQYSEYRDQVEAFDESTPTLAEGVAWGEKPVIDTGDYNGISATVENPVVSFNKTSASNTDDRVRMIFRFEKGTVEDSARWVLVKTVNLE